jgi:hypothetical protein
MVSSLRKSLREKYVLFVYDILHSKIIHNMSHLIFPDKPHPLDIPLLSIVEVDYLVMFFAIV